MMKKNNSLFYIIETSKSIFVCKNEKQALEKKAALELLCGEKASYKLMRQTSIEDYLQSAVKKNKTVRWEENGEKFK